MSARSPTDGSSSGSGEFDARAADPSLAAMPAQLKPLDIAVPDSVGPFTIGRRIGSGTCGVVHVALDNRLNREVAIKLSPTGADEVRGKKVPQAQRAFEIEEKAAGRLQHPGIVVVHQSGQHGHLNYLVMEYVVGRTLKTFGKGRDSLPASQCLAIIVECALALEHAHTRHILHRDVKPANVMLSDAGDVKLLDFGIAIGLSDTAGLPRKGPTLGTPNYMSPEQILGRELGPPSDLYSLGAILFELLTGRQLFKASKVRDLFRIVVREVPPRISEYRQDLPRSLGRLVARALSKDPLYRFQSGRDLADALLPYIAPLAFLESRSPTLRRRMQSWQRSGALSGFTPFEMAQLFEHADVKHYAAGASLQAGRDDRPRLLVLIDGLAEFSTQRGVARPWPVRLGAGAVLGAGRLLPGRAPPQVLSARLPVTTLELTAERFAALPTVLQARCQAQRDATFSPHDDPTADNRYWPVDIPLA